MTPNRLAYVRCMRLMAVAAVAGVATMVAVSTAAGLAVEAAPGDPTGVRVAALVAEHDCRVEGYGQTLIPGHAVVDTGTGPRYAAGDVGFSIMAGDRAGTLYAFCV